MNTAMARARLRKQILTFVSDESGQSTTEYILIIGLISLPIYLAFNVVLKDFLRDFIASLIGSFTRG